MFLKLLKHVTWVWKSVTECQQLITITIIQNSVFYYQLWAPTLTNLFFDAGKDHIVPLVYQDMKGSEGTPLTPATSSLTYSGLIP